LIKNLLSNDGAFSDVSLFNRASPLRQHSGKAELPSSILLQSTCRLSAQLFVRLSLRIVKTTAIKSCDSQNYSQGIVVSNSVIIQQGHVSNDARGRSQLLLSAPYSGERIWNSVMLFCRQ